MYEDKKTMQVTTIAIKKTIFDVFNKLRKSAIELFIK